MADQATDKLSSADPAGYIALPDRPVKVADKPAYIATAGDGGVDQADIVNLATAECHSKQANVICIGPVDGQTVDAIAKAVEDASVTVSPVPNGHKPRSTVPTGGIGGVDVVAKQVVGRDIIAHGL